MVLFVQGCLGIADFLVSEQSIQRLGKSMKEHARVQLKRISDLRGGVWLFSQGTGSSFGGANS